MSARSTSLNVLRSCHLLNKQGAGGEKKITVKQLRTLLATAGVSDADIQAFKNKKALIGAIDLQVIPLQWGRIGSHGHELSPVEVLVQEFIRLGLVEVPEMPAFTEQSLFSDSPFSTDSEDGGDGVTTPQATSNLTVTELPRMASPGAILSRAYTATAETALSNSSGAIPSTTATGIQPMATMLDPSVISLANAPGLQSPAIGPVPSLPLFIPVRVWLRDTRLDSDTAGHLVKLDITVDLHACILSDTADALRCSVARISVSPIINAWANHSISRHDKDNVQDTLDFIVTPFDLSLPARCVATRFLGRHSKSRRPTFIVRKCAEDTNIEGLSDALISAKSIGTGHGDTEVQLTVQHQNIAISIEDHRISLSYEISATHCARISQNERALTSSILRCWVESGYYHQANVNETPGRRWEIWNSSYDIKDNSVCIGTITPLNFPEPDDAILNEELEEANFLSASWCPGRRLWIIVLTIEVTRPMDCHAGHTAPASEDPDDSPAPPSNADNDSDSDTDAPITGRTILPSAAKKQPKTHMSNDLKQSLIIEYLKARFDDDSTIAEIKSLSGRNATVISQLADHAQRVRILIDNECYRGIALHDVQADSRIRGIKKISTECFAALLDKGVSWVDSAKVVGRVMEKYPNHTSVTTLWDNNSEKLGMISLKNKLLSKKNIVYNANDYKTRH